MKQLTLIIYTEGLFYVNQLNLSEFNSLPATGVWVLQVYDDMPNNAGILESITLAVNYKLSNTLLVQPTNIPPTTAFTPPQSIPSSEPTPNPNKNLLKPNILPIATQVSSLATQGTWVIITSQDFEGIFLNIG